MSFVFLELELFTVTNVLWLSSRTVFTIIILLYLLSLLSFAFEWSYVCSGFIDQGVNLWTVYQEFAHAGHTVATLSTGIISGICTIITDFTLVCVAVLIDY